RTVFTAHTWISLPAREGSQEEDPPAVQLATSAAEGHSGLWSLCSDRYPRVTSFFSAQRQRSREDDPRTGQVVIAVDMGGNRRSSDFGNTPPTRRDVPHARPRRPAAHPDCSQ